MQLLQKGDAPAASSARAAALRKLARHARSGLAYEIHQLAFRDVEAVADFVVEIHVCWRSGSCGAKLYLKPSVS
jgi:hypothetical protein